MSETMKDLPAPVLPVPALPSPAWKLAWVALVLLAMLVPQWLIEGVIDERAGRHAAVRQEIGAAWGGPQDVMAPVLAVPWTGAEGRRGVHYIQADRLEARAELAPQTRRRGLYEVPVYTATLAMEGEFRPGLVTVPQDASAVLHWGQATILAGSNAMRLVGDAPALTWAGREVPALEGGGETGDCVPVRQLRWNAGLLAAPERGAVLPFALTMALRGSQSLMLRPGPARGRLAMQGAWATPSFVGDDLPQTLSVEASGFAAEWTLAREGAGGRPNLCSLRGGGAGVELLEAVPTYRMVSRASKYALLFLALSFVTYLMFEFLAGLRIHLVQYGLLGCSVVLFPLLLLAVGEPLGFAVAYGVSTLAVMAQASLFTAAVTGRRALAGVFAGVLAALFGFLYVVLSLEAYALLVGTLALFIVLSVVMAATRRVKWGGE